MPSRARERKEAGERRIQKPYNHSAGTCFGLDQCVFFVCFQRACHIMRHLRNRRRVSVWNSAKIVSAICAECPNLV
jgi:hypothetical protein